MCVTLLRFLRSPAESDGRIPYRAGTLSANGLSAFPGHSRKLMKMQKTICASRVGGKGRAGGDFHRRSWGSQEGEVAAVLAESSARPSSRKVERKPCTAISQMLTG
jgi:hypothetical protein